MRTRKIRDPNEDHRISEVDKPLDNASRKALQERRQLTRRAAEKANPSNFDPVLVVGNSLEVPFSFFRLFVRDNSLPLTFFLVLFSSCLPAPDCRCYVEFTTKPKKPCKTERSTPRRLLPALYFLSLYSSL